MLVKKWQLYDNSFGTLYIIYTIYITCYITLYALNFLYLCCIKNAICVPTDRLVARWFRMWVAQPKIRVFNFFLELHIINIKFIFMKKNKSKNDIEKVRKNSKWLKLFENIPYNNSKVGETFIIMKASSRKTKS